MGSNELPQIKGVTTLGKKTALVPRTILKHVNSGWMPSACDLLTYLGEEIATRKKALRVNKCNYSGEAQRNYPSKK